jgi:hypothetical protein
MLQSLLVIRSVFTEAAEHGYECYAYATSAVRDADNGAFFALETEQILGEGAAAFSPAKRKRLLPSAARILPKADDTGYRRRKHTARESLLARELAYRVRTRKGPCAV